MEAFDSRALEVELAERALFIRRLAYRLIEDHHDVDDIVQEAMLASVQGRQAARLERAWWARVTINLSYLLRRRRERRIRRECVAARNDVHPPVDEMLVRESTRASIARAVAALHEPYRTTIRLLYFEELSLPEVASREDCSIETVRTRKKRALGLLRARLEAEHGDCLRALLALVALGDGAPGAELLAPRAPRRTSALHSATLAGGAALVLCIVASLLLLSQATFRREAPALPESVSERTAVFIGDPALPNRAAQSSLLGSPPTESTTPAPFRITGRVIDETGRAVAGARVGVRRSQGDEVMIAANDSWDLEAKTGRDGAFALQFSLGRFTLEARADGAMTAERLVIERAGRDEIRGVELVVGPSFAASGRVVDANGRPVAGVQVTTAFRRNREAERLSPWDKCWFVYPKRLALTNERGEFSFASLPTAVNLLRIASSTAGTTIAPESGPVTIVTEPLVSLIIRAHDEEGRELSEVSIRALGRNGFSREGRTTADGVAALSDLERGRVVCLRVERAGFAPAVLGPLAVGGEASVDVVLRAPRRVVGHVRRGLAPVAGAGLSALVDLDWTDLMVRDFTPRSIGGMAEIATVRTGAQGEFEFESLPGQGLELLLSLSDGAVPIASVRLAAVLDRIDVDVDELARGAIRLAIEPLDANSGRRISGVTCTALPVERARRFGPIPATVGVDGAVSLLLPEAGQWYLWIAAPQYASVFLPYRAPETGAGTAPVELRVELAAQRSLRVKLLDRAGRPVGDTAVRVRDGSGRPLPVQTSPISWIDRVYTNPLGELLLENIPALPVELAAEIAGRGGPPTRAFDLTHGNVEEDWLLDDLDLAANRRVGSLQLQGIRESRGERHLQILVKDLNGAIASSWTGRISEGDLRADEVPAVRMLHCDQPDHPAWAREEAVDHLGPATAQGIRASKGELTLLFPIGAASVQVMCDGHSYERFFPPLPGQATFSLSLDPSPAGR